jgi:radical SAM superfamily enzyme YgiQ (UPF0313 family)
MRILLVQPATFEPGRLGLENSLWLSEPVALTSIAGMLPEHEIRLLDMRLEKDTELNRVLLDFRPDLVATTSMTTDCYQARAVLANAKGTLGDRVFTIVGGHHPTLAPDAFEDGVVDALAMGEGEDTFKELVAHLEKGGSRHELHEINGLRFRESGGRWWTTPKRHQIRDLDTFPAPARHLIPQKYRSQYFFFIASPMASMFSSRGCSFDCNFCAIWEFYERRTRFMSASVICDRMQTMDEKFVFLLDDNFLTSRKRIEELCEQIEKRRIRKYLLTQGRTDFIAENPDLMRRLRDCGLMMVLSGYETNDDDALAALRKKNTFEKNRRAAEILRELGVLSTGIFMVRPEFEEKDFDELYRIINEMGIGLPLVTILTPLPGTELYRQRERELLTKDARFFDLLHAVLPTRIPRAKFYEKFCQYNAVTWPSKQWAFTTAIKRRPRLFVDSLPGALRFHRRAKKYRPIFESPETPLRDELGIIPADVMATTPRRVELPLLREVRS